MIDILRYFQIIVYAITFIYSLNIRKNRVIPSYMKGFYWYPTMGILIGVVWILSNVNLISLDVFKNVNLISLIFHFSFLSLFIFRVINNKILIRKLKFLFWLFELLIIGSIIIDHNGKTGISYILTNLGLSIFSIFYYYNLFQNIPKDNLLNEPSFWIITGIFFGVSVNIPILAFSLYLYNVSKQIYFTLSWIAPFGYIVMYIFFIKGIKCSLHPPRQ